MKLLKKLVPVVLFLMAVGALYALWGGFGGKVSYRDMACGFEERSLNCLDSIDEWNRGLVFYDSTLSVTNDTLGALKSLLWEFWNIEFAGAGEAAVSRESILPLQVLQTKKSGCMGLSWLAMMVAESRGIALNTVLLPGHVFLRYGGNGDSKESINLEPNRRGHSYKDEEYRQKYENGPWTGMEFKPLTSAQFMGLAAFDMGNLYLDSNVQKALTWYRVAEDFFPEYPGISTNQKIAKSRLPDRL